MKQLPLTGEVFSVEGRPVFVILPDRRAAVPQQPWVWYAPTLPKHPGNEERWMFEQFVAAGIGIAGIDVGESYGSPAGVERFQSLFEILTQERGFSPMPILLARSRGGLMLYNWAAEHAESVSRIAGIYPVCNLASYPGLPKAAAAYALSEHALRQRLNEFNPIERLAPLARAGVPIFHVHGDDDDVVPLEQNSGMLKDRYDDLGGKMTLEVVTGGAHDLAEHWFQCQSLVDFVLAGVNGE